MQEQSIGVAKLKAEFSSILTKVQNGEEFVIEYGKNHKKVAKIIAYEEYKPERQFGQLKGKIFNYEDSDDEIDKLFEGSDDDIIYT